MYIKLFQNKDKLFLKQKHYFFILNSVIYLKQNKLYLK